MKVYLAKFFKGEFAPVYKIGYTSNYDAIKRFKHKSTDEWDRDYDFFDGIEIIADIYFSNPKNHLSDKELVLLAKSVESTLQAFYPKNLWFEDYYKPTDHDFTGMSGITECFVLKDDQTEKQIIAQFKLADKKIRKAIGPKNEA